MLAAFAVTDTPNLCAQGMHTSESRKKIKPSSPVNVPELKKALRNHPNLCCSVSYLITELIRVFLLVCLGFPKHLLFVKNYNQHLWR